MNAKWKVVVLTALFTFHFSLTSNAQDKIVHPDISYAGTPRTCEIAGITVDARVIALYEGADRERGEALAVAISAEVARRIAPYVDGYYLITPFGRAALVGRIMEAIREETANSVPALTAF